MNKEEIIKELNFKATRSSGAGGQHVNKVSSKVELTFDLSNSNALSDKEKELLIEKLSSRLTKENILILFCDESRSQHKNKDLIIKKFLELLSQNLVRPKKRRPTKPSISAIQKRIDSKQRNAEKKSLRKKPNHD
ncbi:alternative ribosome rescue aminoacyl-tRNA hydrolase ArfB [Wenyingzhuangia marina]|uniref:Ribosome-associated protein n=1 Tax=Wenyingzhuangia marina TaxID=1195760 RepID=A0A1M5U5Q1_9FLAO|nr:alternative ribosome rescue aminoacyl-tRNA hydrolase ArfB [Wenyingzhuangia marina]GGF69379.1 aminoacyl-tRNA hydrolase [Wenyingzhuangia marina]SHH58405.1 ribosome-associated protein [Wenyingzhuangia marina]